MKLLFDQNLSHKLVQRVTSLFPDSSHVYKIGLQKTDDSVIWNYARKQGFTLVTQDADFFELSLLNGIPPKIIWLRCGNTSTSFIHQLLIQNENLIREFIENPETDCLQLY